MGWGHISFLIEMVPLIQTLKGQSQVSVLDGCRCCRSHDHDGIFRHTLTVSNLLQVKTDPTRHCKSLDMLNVRLKFKRVRRVFEKKL